MSLLSVISRNVRQFREEQGLSQSALAQRSGLSKQTILGVESGKANPTVETFEALADALGVSARALISEMGSEVLFQSGDLIQWHDQGPLSIRNLDQAYGSGYVHNAIIRLDSFKGAVRSLSGTRGMLRHCYVLEGAVELGPEGRTVQAEARDFVRFPGEGPHSFQPITPIAMLFVVTTTPQLSSRYSSTVF